MKAILINAKINNANAAGQKWARVTLSLSLSLSLSLVSGHFLKSFLNFFSKILFKISKFSHFFKFSKNSQIFTPFFHAFSFKNSRKGCEFSQIFQIFTQKFTTFHKFPPNSRSVQTDKNSFQRRKLWFLNANF